MAGGRGRGPRKTSQVLSTAVPLTRSTKSIPKYLAPRTRASSSGLDADSMTYCFYLFIIGIASCFDFYGGAGGLGRSGGSYDSTIVF